MRIEIKTVDNEVHVGDELEQGETTDENWTQYLSNVNDGLRNFTPGNSFTLVVTGQQTHYNTSNVIYARLVA